MGGAIVFLVLYIIGVFGGGYVFFTGPNEHRLLVGGNLIMWILVGILGWHAFGDKLFH